MFLCPLTCRLSLSMLTTILVSSHCTLRPTFRVPWCSSGSLFSQGRSSREEGRGRWDRRSDTGGGKGKGKPERREAAPGPGWGLESRRMGSSGGNMLSRGSTTPGNHTWLKAHDADFTGREITQDYDHKIISREFFCKDCEMWNISHEKKCSCCCNVYLEHSILAII